MISDANNIVSYFFYSTLGLMLFLMLIYLWYFWSTKKSFRSYSLNLQIRSILGVALLSAVSVAVVFVFSRFSSIMVIPSVRVAFEGVLVKIAGFLFGPIIGIASAIVTEIAVLVFIPTYFYYKFLLILISFGAFSGLVRVFLTAKAKKGWLLLIIYLGTLLFFGLTIFFFYTGLERENSLSFLDWENFIFYFEQQYLTKFNLQTIGFYSNLIIFFFFFVFLFLAAYYLNTGGKDWKWIKRRTLLELLPIIVLTLFSEYFISVFIATNANSAVFGETSKSVFLLFMGAIVIAPIKIIINTIVVYSVWKAFHFRLKKQAFEE